MSNKFKVGDRVILKDCRDDLGWVSEDMDDFIGKTTTIIDIQHWIYLDFPISEDAKFKNKYGRDYAQDWLELAKKKRPNIG